MESPVDRWQLLLLAAILSFHVPHPAAWVTCLVIVGYLTFFAVALIFYWTRDLFDRLRDSIRDRRMASEGGSEGAEPGF